MPKDRFTLNNWRFERQDGHIIVSYRDTPKDNFAESHRVKDDEETFTKWCRMHVFPHALVEELYGLAHEPR